MPYLKKATLEEIVYIVKTCTDYTYPEDKKGQMYSQEVIKYQNHMIGTNILMRLADVNGFKFLRDDPSGWSD